VDNYIIWWNTTASAWEHSAVNHHSWKLISLSRVMILSTLHVQGRIKSSQCLVGPPFKQTRPNVYFVQGHFIMAFTVLLS